MGLIRPDLTPAIAAGQGQQPFFDRPGEGDAARALPSPAIHHSR